MNRVLAIAAISLRSAIRSKIVLLLMIPLAFSAVGVPLLLEGDGTLEGKSRILLNYSLWFTLMILSIVTLWSGCASISSEIHEKVIQLVLAKPVSRLHVWLGKWLSLLVMNAGLLAFAGLAVYIGLQWQLRDPGTEAQVLNDKVLTSRKLVMHDALELPPDAVRQSYEAFKRQNAGEVPPFSVIRRQIEGSMLEQEYIVPKQGSSMLWRFRVPDRLDPDRPLFLRYQFRLANSGTETESPGEFRFGNDIEPLVVAHGSMREQELEIPKSIIGDDGLVEISYFNQSRFDVLFEREKGPALLYHRESFAWNYIKTLLMMFVQLGLLAAIGVTAGSLFSLPVAALTSLFFILLQLFGGFLQEYKEVTEAGWLSPVYKALAFLTRPLQGESSFELLSTGVQIGLGSVIIAFLVKLLLYSSIVGLIGNILFNRREIGIPSTL